MDNSSKLESFWNVLPQERLKALLLWLESGCLPLEHLSDCFPERGNLSLVDGLDLLSQLSFEEMAHFSLLNEFGMEFREKASFKLLKRAVIRRLEAGNDCPV